MRRMMRGGSGSVVGRENEVRGGNETVREEEGQ